MQDTELTGEVSPAPAAGPAATPPAADQPEQPGAGEEEGRDPEEAAAHHSSGYASSDSSGVGGQAATTTPLTEAAPPIALAQPTALAVSIQSDPQQSAFRPALPAQQVHTVHRLWGRGTGSLLLGEGGGGGWVPFMMYKKDMVRSLSRSVLGTQLALKYGTGCTVWYGI